jgi:O-antigen ligase
MDFGLRIRGEHALAAVAGLTAIALAYLSLARSVEPAWVLAAITGVLLALFVMRRWPVLLLVGLLFVGNFKTTAAQGISFADPTMILLLLTAGAVFLEILFMLGRVSEWTLHDLFRGQQLGIISFVAFVSIVAISYLYTAAPHYGGEKVARFLVFKPLVFFAALILLKREKEVRQALAAFFTLGLALTAKDIFDFLHPTQRVLSGDTDTTHIGDAQLIGMTLLILFFSSSFRRFPKILGVAAVLFLGAGLIACTARGPLLSALFVLLVYSVVARKMKGFLSYKQILAGLVLFVVVIATALSQIDRYPAAQAKVAEKQKELVAFFQGASDPGGTMEQRLDFYHSAVSALAEKPLTGWGVGGWPVFYYGYERDGFPHNIILEVAAEQGFLGLAILFAFLTANWLAACNIWKLRPDLAVVLPLFAFSLLVCMFSSDLNARTLWFWGGAVFAINRMCISEAAAGMQLQSNSPYAVSQDPASQYAPQELRA